MAPASHVPPPMWFRVVAIIGVVWNAFGVVMYLSSVGVFGDPTTGLNEAERAAANSIPPLITGVFAIGTFAGLIGSFGLAMRELWAVPVLILSLAALLTLEGWIVFLSGALDLFGLAVPITVTVGAIFLAWLASHARARSWLAKEDQR